MSAVAASEVYRAFWRWHFYAGLLVLPVLMLMALTGGFYLFRDEIDSALYGRLHVVEPRAIMTSADEWIEAAQRSVEGSVVSMTPPAAADRSVALVVKTSSDLKRTVFVDPYDLHVLGVVEADTLGRFSGGPLMSTMRRLHSLDFVTGSNVLVEVVACWAIVLVVTGTYLWWPRGQDGGVVTVREGPRKRVFWRDVHAVTGVFVGSLIVFLAVTGMPWSALWGKQVQRMVTAANWGKPGAPSVVDEHAEHRASDDSDNALPWTLQQMHVHAGRSRPALAAADIVAIVDEAGLAKPFVLSIPSEHNAVWSAAYIPNKVEGSRTLYVDGGTGEIVRDVGYENYGPAAKVIEWGVSVHIGRQFGWVSQLLMLAGCIGIWVLGISAATMWWKRRPTGKLASPRPPADKRAYITLSMLVVPLAVLYPLVGATLVAALLLDLILKRIADSRR